MTNRIFRVDLAEDARDFQHTATEPGLAMLDQAGANHLIMRRWIGDLAAEPEWEQDETVAFFIGQKEQGRLADLECRPATAADLQGPLKEDLDTIRSRIKQAKAESTTEEVLLRVVRQSLKATVDDLDVSDCDCYFFKYRQTKQPWKLVWCWGYQRTDMEPSPASICPNPQCNRLFARRPKKKLCPYCQTSLVAKKTERSYFDAKSIAALLLLLAVGLFFLLNQPRLVVTPGNWSGPPGSRVEFVVKDRRWYFFEDDVTSKVKTQSHDSRVLQFGPGGRTAIAKTLGRTEVTFLYQDRVTAVTIEVAPAERPESISIDPGSAQLAVGSTARLKVIGHYSNGSSIDLTDLAEWEATDREVVFAHAGRLEGASPGKTTVVARYQAVSGTDRLEASADVSVAKVEFKSIAVHLDPSTLAIGQSGKIDIVVQGADGNEYSLTGSPMVRVSVAPSKIASISNGFVEGLIAGKGDLNASYFDLKNSLSIAISSDSYLPEGTFSVQPPKIELAVGELFPLDVVTASDALIESESSDSAVVDLLGSDTLVGVSPGNATITVRQGDDQQVVEVSVVEFQFESLRIEPSPVTMNVGETTVIRVVGRGDDGREIDLNPASLTWIKRPLLQHADLKPETLELYGIAPTSTSMTIEVRHQDGLSAEANVRVFSSDPTLAGTEDDFQSYPPIPLTGGFMAGDLFSDDVLGDLGLAPDTLIAEVDGRPLVGKSLRYWRDYFDDHPLEKGDMLRYRDADGQLREKNYDVLVQEVEFGSVTARNESATDFQIDLSVNLRHEAEYRVVDGNGQPLSEFVTLGPGLATLSTTPVARSSNNKYEFWVERKLDGEVEKFQFKATLERGQ